MRTRTILLLAALGTALVAYAYQNYNVQNLVVHGNETGAAGAGKFDWSAATGTFKTSTGTNTINGSLALAANKGITCTSGTGSPDFSSCTGAFKTSTGAGTIGGDTTLSANVDLTFASGDGGLDMSASYGPLKGPLGVTTMYGPFKQAYGTALANSEDGGVLTPANNGNIYSVTATTSFVNKIALVGTGTAICLDCAGTGPTFIDAAANVDGGLLNIAGDFACSAADSICLRDDGTAWREVSRSAN